LLMGLRVLADGDGGRPPPIPGLVLIVADGDGNGAL